MRAYTIRTFDKHNLHCINTHIYIYIYIYAYVFIIQFEHLHDT